METLAYTHLAAAYEEAANNELHLAGINWKKLSSRTFIRFLSLAMALSVVSMAGNAFAALRRGNSGAQVTNLQTRLITAGYYNGPVTGYFGSLTEAAVKRFQQAKKISVDGVAGSVTLSYLPNSGGGGTGYPSRTLSRGSSGQDVVNLQNKLRSSGFYNGPVTGYYGSLTEAAVKRFQQYYGLKSDGIVGSRTLGVIQSVAIVPSPSRLS